ncbi:MAG: DUF4388 domain-containing protein [Acidobacteriota bacterium]
MMEGNLADNHLVSLIQKACLEGRSASLVLRHRAQEGAIFFMKGEMLHAVLGKTEGEEAFHQLITWHDGFFRIIEQEPLPYRTIHKDWQEVLREAETLNLITLPDDAQVVAKVSASSNFAFVMPEMSEDEQLEFKLIGLLANLERLVVKLSEPKMQKNGEAVLQNLTEMVNQLVDFVMNYKKPLAAQSLLLKNASDDFLQFQPSAKTALCDHCQHQVQTLATFFAKIEEDYQTPSMRDEWREMYEIFLSALNNQLAKVSFV